MKLNTIFLIGIAAVAGLSSCVSEDLKSEQEKLGMGRMALDVSLLQPETVTRTQTEVTDFPVEVESADGKYDVKYLSVSDVPASVELPAGEYTVSSHSNLTLEKSMSVPYYQGAETMTIHRGETTDVDVVCKMLNSRIAINYGDDFLNAFTGWTITLNDGSGTVLYFDNNSVNEYYWYFENHVENLWVDFRGTLAADGSTVTSSSRLNKSWDTVQKYGDDVTYYRGGDAIEINLGVNPVDGKTGKVTDIIINAYVTFAEVDDDPVELEVTDAKDDNSGNDPGNDPGNEPTPGDDSAITLNLPQNMVVDGDTEPELGDTYIKCDKGIKSIKVKIDSSSDEMLESLAEVNDNYGVDFITGAEVVENEDLVSLFEDLGPALSVPEVGDEEYTFPIGNFFFLLGYISGEHTFYLTIEDGDGNKKNGVLVLTVE